MVSGVSVGAAARIGVGVTPGRYRLTEAAPPLTTLTIGRDAELAAITMGVDATLLILLRTE